MAEQVLARRISVPITFDGTDITKDIKPYFRSLRYTDDMDDLTDDIQIGLQDRDSIWLESWLQKAVEAAAGGKLKISAVITPENWGNNGTLPTGDFELDTVDASGPPSIVTIKGTSLAFSASLRQTKKSKAWENYTLSGIASEIAGGGGMGCMYESAANPSYDRVEQVNQSDIDFLKKLCEDAGISIKATDGKIVLFDLATYEAKPPVITIKRGKEGGYTKYKLSSGSADTQYSKCRVSYMDPATGKLIEGTAEDSSVTTEQCLEITAKVGSVGEAQALAEKHLRLHNKFSKKISFTFPGNTALVAAVTVQLEDWGAWDGKYLVKKAAHTVDASGYTTKIDGYATASAITSGGAPAETASAPFGGSTYTVKKGDSLWKIAKQLCGSGADWKKIYEANKDIIGENPNLIYPGQTFTIPD